MTAPKEPAIPATTEGDGGSKWEYEGYLKFLRDNPDAQGGEAFLAGIFYAREKFAIEQASSRLDQEWPIQQKLIAIQAKIERYRKVLEYVCSGHNDWLQCALKAREALEEKK